jgi:hypothetical protein
MKSACSGEDARAEFALEQLDGGGEGRVVGGVGYAGERLVVGVLVGTGGWGSSDGHQPWGDLARIEEGGVTARQLTFEQSAPGGAFGPVASDDALDQSGDPEACGETVGVDRAAAPTLTRDAFGQAVLGQDS